MTATWRRLKERLVTLLSSDVDVVRRVEQMEKHQREIGHRIRDLEMRKDAIARLVNSMRADGEDGNERDYIH